MEKPERFCEGFSKRPVEIIKKRRRRPPCDFHQVAAKFQLPVQSTGEFSRTAPDPKLKADPQLTTAAFQLTAQDPNSDIIQGQDGFYVLHLAGVTEARPFTLEEMRHIYLSHDGSIFKVSDKPPAGLSAGAPAPSNVAAGSGR